jgi:multicomponent Na+:H+ antiporter subunit D
MSPLELVVIVPLVGLVLTVWTRGRQRTLTGIAAASGTALAAIALAVRVHADASPTSLRIPGPAGVEAILVADGLAAAMVLMTSVVGVLVSAYALQEDVRAGWVRHRGYWPSWLALWSALHVLFLAGDLLTAYLMLELIGVTGAALVALGGDRRTVLAATRYFYAELVASTTVLFGLALLWHRTGTLAFADLAGAVGEDRSLLLPLAIVTVGLLVKVPLVPLHFWLPPAHALAPGAVSPALSAVVVKTAFAVLVRLWFLAVPTLITRSAAQLLGMLGAAAILWGSVNALRDRGLKMLVAHSTVAQLGFLFLLPPLVADGGVEAWSGGIMFAIAHALAKAAMLMAAAILVEDLGEADVEDLGGVAGRRPVAVLAFGIGAVSLVGLPPSGGFVGKWYLLVASLETGQWWWVPVIVLGSLLTAGYLMRVVKRSFAPAAPSVTAGAARDGRDVVALGLALTTLVLGLRPAEILELLDVGSPFPLGGG